MTALEALFTFQRVASGLLFLNLLIWGAVLLRWLRRRRHWLGAFLEQGRVESEHHTDFRRDQQIHAIQQRLSRTLGKRHAFHLKTKKKIEAELVKMSKG